MITQFWPVVSQYNALVLSIDPAHGGQPCLVRYASGVGVQRWRLTAEGFLVSESSPSQSLGAISDGHGTYTLTMLPVGGQQNSSACRWQFGSDGRLVHVSSGLLLTCAAQPEQGQAQLVLSHDLPSEPSCGRWFQQTPTMVSSAATGSYLRIVAHSPEDPDASLQLATQGHMSSENASPDYLWWFTNDGAILSAYNGMCLTLEVPAAPAAPSVGIAPRSDRMSQSWIAMPLGALCSTQGMSPQGPTLALAAPSDRYTATVGVGRLMPGWPLDATLRWVFDVSLPQAEQAHDLKWAQPYTDLLVDWILVDDLICLLSQPAAGLPSISCHTMSTGELVQSAALPLPLESGRVPPGSQAWARPVNRGRPTLLAQAWGKIAVALVPPDSGGSAPSGTAPAEIFVFDPQSGAVSSLATLPDSSAILTLIPLGDDLLVLTMSTVYRLTDDGQLSAACDLSPAFAALSPTTMPGGITFSAMARDGLLCFGALGTGAGNMALPSGWVGAWLLDSDSDSTPTASALLWSVGVGPTDSDSALFLNELHTDGATLYWATSGTIHAVDLRSGVGRYTISAPQNTMILGIALGAQRIYAALDGGGIVAYDTADGSARETFDVVENLTTPPLFAEGMLYASSPSLVYAFDTQDTTEELQIALGGTHILGARDGIVFLADGSRIYAHDLAQVVHMFSVDSELMQDFEPTGKSGAAGLQPVPVYHVEVALTTQDHVAKVGEAVEIWATGPLSTMINGTSYQIDAQTPAIVRTSAAGKIKIEVPATSLVVPALLLWASFMDDNEQIVIYPDHQAHGRIAALDGDSLKALQGYDGKPALGPDYQGDDSQAAQARTATVQALQGLVQVAGTVRQPSGDAPATRHLAADSLDKGAQHMPDLSFLTRPPGNPQAWLLDLSIPGGSFQAMSQSQADAWKSQNAGSATTGDHSFWDTLKSGAAKVGHVLLDVAEVGTGVGLVIALVTGDGPRLFRDVIDTLEKVGTLIESVFHTIGVAASKALECLSYLFDWDDILTNHQQIVGWITSALDQLKTGDLIDQAQDYSANSLRTMKRGLSDAFDSARTMLGQQSFNGAQTLHPQDPQARALRGGSTGVKHSWLTHKLNNAAAADGASGTHEQPFATFDGGLSSALEGFLSQLTSEISDDVQQKLLQFQSGFSQLSASTILQGSIAALLTGIELIADVVIDLLDSLVTTALELWKTLLASPVLQTLLTTEIQLPFVTSLYHYITKTDAQPNGSPMTLIDLLALLAAIPCTIMSKLMAAESNVLRSGSGSTVPPLSPGMAAAALTIFAYMPLDAVLEILGDNFPLLIQFFWGVLLPLVIVLIQAIDAIQTMHESVLVPTLLILFLVNVPILVDTGYMAKVLKAMHDYPSWSERQILELRRRSLARYDANGQLLLLTSGIFCEIFVVLMHWIHGFSSSAPTIIGNCLPPFAMMSKMLRRIPPSTYNPDGKYITAAIDLALNFGCGVCGMLASRSEMRQRSGPDQSGLAAPDDTPQVRAGTAPQAGRWVSGARVRYAYSCVVDAWESPISPWSDFLQVGVTGGAEVSWGIDRSLGLSAYRVYRQFVGDDVELVFQTGDQQTSRFLDSLP